MILSNRKLKLIIISLLLLIFCWFVGLFNVHADSLSIDADYGVIYGTNANVTNNPNSNTTWNWGYYKENIPRVDAMEIYFHATQDTTSFNQYATFMVGGWNTSSYSNDLSTNPFSIGGAVLKVQGATYMCSVDSNNSNSTSNFDVGGTTSNNTTTNTWSATINCDTSSGVNIGTANNVASLWIQVNSTGIQNYNTFTYLISKNMYFSNSKIFGNSQAIQNIQNDTNSIKDSINNSDIDNNNTSSSASSWNSKNATNGTITQLLTLPISLLQAIVNGIQTSCSSFSLGSLFGTNITLPCINISTLIGSGLFTTIDILISGFMILSISKKMIKIFNDFTNLKSNQIDELYGGGSK